MMSLPFGLFTQVSGSGPLGPLVNVLRNLIHCLMNLLSTVMMVGHKICFYGEIW